MGDTDITLWMNTHKYEALEAELSRLGSNIETELNCHLDQMYEQIVPTAERNRVEDLLTTEEAMSQKEVSSSRELSLIRIMEDGTTQYFQTDIYKSPHLIAQRCALALQLSHESQAEPNTLTATAFSVREPIDSSKFEALCEQWGGNPNLIAAVAVDFDSKNFSILSEDGWKSCSLQTAVKAANAAFRKEFRPDQERLSIFYARISGELTPTPEPQEAPDKEPTPTLGM